MNIIVDTNVLLRVALNDNAEQTRLAEAALAGADSIALSVVTLCEFVWVLSRTYGRPRAEIAGAIRTLLSSEAVRVDRTLADAGLAMLEQGGDFADGIIAADGLRLGGEVFVSFDRQASRLVRQAGGRVLVPADNDGRR